MSEQNEVQQQKKMGFGMMLAMWIVVLAMLTMFFSSWYEKQYNPNQSVMTALGEDGIREVVLQRNRYGHYVANGDINGQEVAFMLDTGASDIAIPGELAKRLQLEKGPRMLYRTANGSVVVYATRLASVSLGDIHLQNVRASINPSMEGEEILLGMSFLKSLEFTQRGDTLTIRQLPKM